MQPEEAVERRIVTILFADLVGFTTLSEQFDAEDVAAIQDSYFATVRETVGRYGGRLEKFIGDAAMAVFGVPRSRDDDAERAVRAGLALVHGIAQIGAQLGLDEETLRLRVGINTGEAVIAAGGPDEGRITGDTVNTAARLQTAAPPGGVLAGETTALAVAEVAEMEPVASLELKGKAEPSRARLVIGFRPAPSREQAMGAMRAPTLGRDEELAALASGHARASEGGVERWLVIAPPGVGKSRLLREFADRVVTGGGRSVIWRSRARSESVSPFDPIAGLLLDALPTDRAAAEAALPERLAASGVPAGRAQVVTEACLALAWPAEAEPDPGRPTEDRAVLFGAWLDGLDALAGGATAVWLIEDVHWAGGDVLAFLDLAGSRPTSSEGGGRLIVTTARPSLLESSPEWSRDDVDSGRHVLQLATLAPTDARELVSALVGDALPAGLVDRVVERSDGNCLFIEELLRTWASVGTLVASDGGWRLAVAAEEIGLPASVQSIYAAQLDDLPSDARRLARRASVAGRRFPLGALEPLGAEAATGLEPLRRRELVTGPLAEPVWGEAFAYRHALLRDAGYASLARAERARLHVRLARWLEQAAGEHGTEVAEQIAGHYAAALESLPALAREVDDGLDREAVGRLAAEWYERAGQGTLSLAAHDAARQLFRRSIDLTADEARVDKARRWERLGDATAFAADMDEGAAAYGQAMELYRQAIAAGSQGFDRGSGALTQASDAMEKGVDWLARLSVEGAEALREGARELRAGAEQVQAGKAEFEQGMAAAKSGLARAAASLSDVMYQQLRFAESRALAETVIDEIGEADPGSLSRLTVAKAMGALGAGGPTPEVRSDVENALALARQSGEAATELRALSAVTVVRSETGHASLDDWRRLERVALDVGDWPAAIAAMINGAKFLVDADAGSVYAAAERARQAAMAHGRTEDGGWADYVETEAAFASGEWDRAVTVGTRAINLGEANAYLRLTVRTWHVLIPISAVRGNQALLQRAARWYADLEGKIELPDSPYARIMEPAQRLELAAAGLVEPFTPDVEPRIAAFAAEPGGPSYCAALDRLLRAWLDAGELDGATRAMAALSEAMPTFSDVTPIGQGTFELMRARLAAARGEAGEAAAAGRAALDHFRLSSAPWWMAKAIRLLERVGASDAALLEEVAQIERHLGAVAPTA